MGGVFEDDVHVGIPKGEVEVVVVGEGGGGDEKAGVEAGGVVEDDVRSNVGIPGENITGEVAAAGGGEIATVGTVEEWDQDAAAVEERDQAC